MLRILFWDHSFFYKTLAVSLIVPSGFDGPATLIIVPKHQGG